MKIVITGGHVTPALAVIEKLKEKIPEVKIIFVGRKSTAENDHSESFEFQLVTKIPGVQFVNLTTGRLRRFFSLTSIISLFKVPVGFIQSFFLLKREQPRVILTFGGYLGVPVTVAGWLLGIPIVVHEQTISIGLANKFIANFAKIICVSSDDNLNVYPKNKAVVTGNPLRKEICLVNKSSQFREAKKFGLPIIYITGGSQGAMFLNKLVERNLEMLLKSYVLIHQCGNINNLTDFKRLGQKIKQFPIQIRKQYFLVTHIFPQDIGAVYEVSDLIVGRAGANTVWELLTLNKKALLIPLPYGQKKEQEQNAQFLEQEGLAKVLKQDEFTDNEFLNAIKEMIKKEIVVNKNSDRQTASEKVATEVLNAASQKS